MVGGHLLAPGAVVTRLLVAADDSPAGLGAARTAVRLAASLGGVVRAVHVLGDGDLRRELEDRSGAGGPAGVRSRQGQGAVAVLRYVENLGASAGVPVETASLVGNPARCILGEAATWAADVIVLGRAGSGHVGEPYVGSQVRHVLEFAEVPVLVVP